MRDEHEGKIIYLGGVEEAPVSREITPTYPREQAGYLVDIVMQLGLDPAFVEIFAQHLSDLHLWVNEDRYTTGGNVADHTTRSQLDVVNPSKEALPLTVDLDEVQPSLIRVFKASQFELEDKVTSLQGALKEFGFSGPDRRKLAGIALDWSFAEQAVAALGNSFHMQRIYGSYIADFNGQSPAYKAEYTISAQHVRDLYDIKEPQVEAPRTVEEDYLRLQQGFGLIALHGSILRHRVINKSVIADWLTKELASEHDLEPYTPEAIARHFAVLEPRDHHAWFEEYFDSLPDVPDDDN